MIGSKAVKNSVPALLEGQRRDKAVSLRDHIDVSHIDYSHCAGCKKPLIHDEYYGKVEGAVFWCTGYKCDKCGHIEGNILKFKYWAKSVSRFDWRAIAVPSNNCKSPERS